MTLNDNLSRTYKAAGARLQLLGKMKSFNHCQSKICYLYIYDYTLADIQLPYPINLYQEAAGQFFFDVQKQCYPMSHSQQVSTTIWSVNLLTWWRSVWTKSLHLIYLTTIFEMIDHSMNARNNKHCVRVPPVKLEVARHGFYFTGSTLYNSLPIPSQHFNVESTLWINLEITLIRRWKWNQIWRRIFNIAQLWYNVSARR